MTTKNFVKGLSVLSSYTAWEDGNWLIADEGKITFVATDIPLSENHLKYLRSLGWFQDTECTEDQPEGYDPDVGWSAYV
jgi:hypothetical protein